MSDSVFLTDGNGTITGLVDTSYAGELIIPEYVNGEKITSIGELAFQTCYSITKVVIPDSVTSIGLYAFSNCYNLTEAVIPYGITSLLGTFIGCGNLSKVVIPDSVVEINNGAFMGTDLSEVIIPDSVTFIGTQAFANCSLLTEVIVQDSVTRIGGEAFMNCSNLAEVSIPDSVTTIMADAFDGCSSLTTVYVEYPDNLSAAVSSHDWTRTGSSGITFLKYIKRNIDYLVKSGTLLDIAEAIREKTGSADSIVVGGFHDAISAISTCPDDALFLEETIPTLPGTLGWSSVCYGAGKYVAVATGGTDVVAYSNDGVRWSVSHLPNTGDWYSVVYGNGTFVAVASGSGSAAYSFDGVVWNTSYLPSSAKWRSVGFGNGTFVTAAYGSKMAAYSTDGITWTGVELPVSSNWGAIGYGNGLFVIVTNSGAAKHAVYSADGITWNSTSLPAYKGWTSVAYGAGKFVVVHTGTGGAAYSLDGITWTSTTTPSASWTDVVFDGTKFVAIGGASHVMYSEDGISWNHASLPRSSAKYYLAYSGSKFVGIANGKNIFVTSEDGITWTDPPQVMSIVDVDNQDVTEETVYATEILDAELTAQDDLITQINTALVGKAGVVLPTLSNPAGAANIEAGYQAINGAGNVLEGSMVNFPKTYVGIATVQNNAEITWNNCVWGTPGHIFDLTTDDVQIGDILYCPSLKMIGLYASSSYLKAMSDNTGSGDKRTIPKGTVFHVYR